MTSGLVPPQNPPVWNTSPDEILSQAKEVINDSKAHFDKFVKIENPTIENFIKPYSALENKRSSISNHLSMFQHVSPDSKVRDASTKAEELLETFYIETGLREDLFTLFKKLYDNMPGDVDAETKRYIEKAYTTFRRNGLDLPVEERKKVEKISKELSDLSIKYNKQLNEQTEFLLFTEKELDGVPEDILNQFEKVTKDGEKYLKVTYKYPDILPTIRYSKNPETRKKAYVGDQNKVAGNRELLAAAVEKRKILANLLGFKTYSDYTLELSMAKSSENVLKFENNLLEKLQKVGKKELETLKELKLNDYKSQGLDVESKEANEYYLWDHSYYNNKLLQEKYQVDEQKISEYFPLQETVSRMLHFYEILFNLKFQKATSKDAQFSTWHEDVEQFSVWKMDNADKPEFLGWIYFDLHPRDGKYGHAAEFEIWPGYYDEASKTKKRPVCALVCNFSKPSKDKPSLLKHNEVTTFFHELGHGIHEIVADTYYGRFHGTTVERDFVEAPSQMLEFWTWSENELKNLSSHYITKEPLSDELVESLMKSKHVNGGLANLRQLHFGLFDMTLHNSEKGENIDIDYAWNELKEKITLLSLGGEKTKGYASFGHMMGGYAAGYYGYLYSEVFATDMYYTLFKKDPMNTANGKRYRDIILKRGGSRDSLENLKELLGREPNSDAFFKEIGLN